MTINVDFLCENVFPVKTIVIVICAIAAVCDAWKVIEDFQETS
jgi:hypothetical protein